MNLTFKILTETPVTSLLEAFNTAFADYQVKMELTKEQLERKLLADSNNLNLSVGAFDGDILVGFILHGTDIIQGKKVVYNGATGVKPAYRGHGLTKALYDFILPVLLTAGATASSLEVLDENIPAIKSYKAVGFQTYRHLICFKGTPTFSEKYIQHNIQELHQPDWDLMASLQDWEPSWQNSMTAMKQLQKSNQHLGIFEGGKLVAYAIFNPENNRIAQVAVHPDHRRKGLASSLFHAVSKGGTTPISIINIDSNAAPTLRFLETIGLTVFISQLEMRKTFDQPVQDS